MATISRRAILKGLALTPALFRPAPLLGFNLPGEARNELSDAAVPFTAADIRLRPHYPAPSPLADILARVDPGADEYVSEKYAAEIEAILAKWSEVIRKSPANLSAVAAFLDAAVAGSRLASPAEEKLRSASGIEVVRRKFPSESTSGRDEFMRQLQAWLGPVANAETVEFEVFGIEEIGQSPLVLQTSIRYDIVAVRNDHRREERVGTWQIDWAHDDVQGWIARHWTAADETLCIVEGPVFTDVTSRALGATESYRQQMLRGADYWRTVLDGAVGLDVYCNNGIAAGDYDNDGFDDLYVCQPAGLPNRLYRNRGDGTFEDVTHKAGVGVLDSTACALFADFDNRGRQDLLVVCGTGPLLFLNNGDGTFTQKRDAFRFARAPQGTFTHAAVADYDGDGRLDVYFCLYMYYLGLDQYHYPIPYYDARNGPPNCLFHNEGNGSFVETTEASGLNADNDRYSFACAWGNANAYGLPDLFVANDFGSSQLYRNNGNGTFTVISREANVESVGAGMSCCWCDYDNDGHQDIYVPSMWEAAGQRVSNQKRFHQDAAANIRGLYQRHARGNALYRNNGNGRFENAGREAGVEMGRWSWSSDFWDFDHDGFSDLYVANGYISGPERRDLAGFFWRQVVARSPEDATPSVRYERGWNAINELIRSDKTWHGYARNVLFLNNGNGTFAEASGAVGLDFLEDSRSFALADIDHDGRLEVILKNRNAPQIRILRNTMQSIGRSLSFRLRGHKTNRDAIGAAITVEAAGLKQTKYLQAGSGFLAQHAKEVFFGIGDRERIDRAAVNWPSGLVQVFDNLPAGNRFFIEEGTDHPGMTPFSTHPPFGTGSSLAPEMAALPTKVESWLVQPLKAPGFSLPDSDGKVHDLETYRGRPVLLAFWSSTAPASIEMVRGLDRNSASRAVRELVCLAVNVDEQPQRGDAQTAARQQQFSVPALFATPEVAGIYNIIYRHLFDRRRDLPIPVSFLLDKEGMIVKVYQGAVEPDRILSDSRSIPSNPEDRMRAALPFPGILVQSKFARNDFTYGVAMFQHGYLEQAAESFKQVIVSKPDNPDAHYNLGTLSLRRHDLQQARQYLERTVELQPDYPEAWNNLGMIAAEEGRSDDAVRNFQESLKYRPNYAIALLNLGNVYRRRKAFDDAGKCLRRALELLPDDAEINYSLGMLYAQQDQMQQAAEYLERALGLRPDYPEALNNLGIIFVRQQDYSRAEEQFKTGIRLSPSFDQSYLNLAHLYTMQNDREHARQILTQLLQVQPENTNAKKALELLQ